MKNYYIDTYKKNIEILIQLENDNLIDSNWAIDNYLKTVAITSKATGEERDYEIPADVFVELDKVKKMLETDEYTV